MSSSLARYPHVKQNEFGKNARLFDSASGVPPHGTFRFRDGKRFPASFETSRRPFTLTAVGLLLILLLFLLLRLWLLLLLLLRRGPRFRR